MEETETAKEESHREISMKIPNSDLGNRIRSADHRDLDQLASEVEAIQDTNRILEAVAESAIRYGSFSKHYQCMLCGRYWKPENTPSHRLSCPLANYKKLENEK